MSDRIKGFLFALVLLAGVGGYLVLEGVGRNVIIVFVAFCAVVMAVSSMGFWSRPKASGRVEQATLSASGGGLLVLLHEGKGRSARRLSDGGLTDAGDVVPAATGDDALRCDNDIVYPDNLARLSMQGSPRAQLHGLQPGPAKPLDFLHGRLVTTSTLIKAPPSPLPVLVVHAETLDPGSAELLTSVDLAGGATRWTARFSPPVIGRARFLFVTADQLIFLPDTRPAEALALDAASGAVRWRVRV